MSYGGGPALTNYQNSGACRHSLHWLVRRNHRPRPYALLIKSSNPKSHHAATAEARQQRKYTLNRRSRSSGKEATQGKTKERPRLATMHATQGARTDSPCIGRGRLLTTPAASMSATNVAAAATTGNPRSVESLRAEAVMRATLPEVRWLNEDAPGGGERRLIGFAYLGALVFSFGPVLTENG